MHTSYRRNFGPENVAELNQSIDAQHEELLKTDDLDKKADFQRYLAGYAMQYLYLVPHNRKFICKETERVLHSSAMRIGDFDPREASLAFEHLARYSHNLLEQPWRADFHIIKLTSGFYVHNVAAHIHNAHELLIAMGYVNTDDVTLKLLPTYNIKSLKAVSRDCYVASQECLILSQIWQRVSDQEPDYPLSIGEVFEFRVKHMGDTDTICKTLLSDIRRLQHEFKLRKHSSQQFQNRHFVPVDKLIEYDGMDIESSHGYNYPERETEIVKKVLENTKLQQEEQHIYDPVFNGRIYSEQGQPTSPFSPSVNNISNNFAFPASASGRNRSHELNNVGTRDKYDRNSVSPMIPQTVSSFCSKSPNRNISQSSSPNSLSGRSAQGIMLQSNGHFNLTKIPEYDKNSRLDQRWPEEYIDNSHVPPSASGRSRKPISAFSYNQLPSNNRKSCPVPCETVRNSSNGYGYIDEKEVTGEDVLNEALEYASEIKDLVPGPGEGRFKSDHIPHHHHKSNIVKSGWDTDSGSASSASRASLDRDSDKKSASSTDASSWDNVSNYRQNHTDFMDLNPHLPHHMNAHNSRIPTTTASSHLITVASPDVRGIKLYSQSQPSTREVYKNDSSTNKFGSSNQCSARRKDKFGMDFQNQYARQYHDLSSSSSSSPHPITPVQMINDQIERSDTVINKYVEQEDEIDIGFSSQQSHQKPYDQPDSMDIQIQKFVEQSKITDKIMGPRRSVKQFDDVPQVSSTRNHGTMVNLEEFNTVSARKISYNNDRKIESEETRNRGDGNVDNTSNEISSTPKLIDKSTDTTLTIDSPKTYSPIPGTSNEIKIEDDQKPLPKEVIPWGCKHCTFINKMAERICEVCAKSKDFVDEPETDLRLEKDSGKAYEPVNQLIEQTNTDASKSDPKPVVECRPDEIQCIQCTLINSSAAKSCDACGYRLREHNSPSRGGFL